MKFGECSFQLGIMAPEMSHLHEDLSLFPCRKIKPNDNWRIDHIGNNYYVSFFWRTPKRPKTYYKSYDDALDACKASWISLAMM